MLKTLTAILGICSVVMCLPAASADLLTLDGGQVLEGKVVETDDTVTLTTPFATVVFTRDEVSGIKYAPLPAEQFRKRAETLEADDAEGYYELGLFAEEKGLGQQAVEAYKMAIQADGNHAEARAKLGYVLEGDAWIPLDEYLEAKGYVQYKGRWVTPEEADELVEADRARIREQGTLLQVKTQVYLIRNSEGQSRISAQEKLSGMSDPAALPALSEAAEDPHPAVRRAALVALSNYREDEAALAVLYAAIASPESDIRYQARAILNAKQNEKALQEAIALLRIDDDELRFTVSEILGAIADPRGIPYLIEALSWTRPGVQAAGPRRRPPAGSYVHGRGRTYIAGYRAKVAPNAVGYEPIIGYIDATGRRRTRGRADGDSWEPFNSELPEVVLNYQALSALQAITGQDYRFDKTLWRNWYLANAQRLKRLPAPVEGLLE